VWHFRFVFEVGMVGLMRSVWNRLGTGGRTFVVGIS
jgi:hypothetical protein